MTAATKKILSREALRQQAEVWRKAGEPMILTN